MKGFKSLIQKFPPHCCQRGRLNRLQLIGAHELRCFRGTMMQQRLSYDHHNHRKTSALPNFYPRRSVCSQTSVRQTTYLNSRGAESKRRYSFLSSNARTHQIYPEQSFDRSFYKNLLHLSLKHEFQHMLTHSIKDYHVKGFNSILLSTTASLNLRLYIVLPKQADLSPDSQELYLHNHHFDFQTQVLKGEMQNVKFREVPLNFVNYNKFADTYVTPEMGLDETFRDLKVADRTKLYLQRNPHAKKWLEYSYESAIIRKDGKMRLHYLKNVVLENHITETIRQGSSYSMDSEEIHRINLVPEKMTILLFWEHREVKNFPRLFALTEQPSFPNVSHLYNQFSKTELKNLLTRAIEEI